MKLIYFHGFGSAASGGTVQALRRLMPDDEIVAPDIPNDPAEALPFLRELCRKENPDIVAGTSMGGMYVQQMFGFRRICINPAFFMSSASSALTPGTYTYFNPRMDGETEFTVTEEIIRHYAEMEERQFDGITDFDREHVWGLFGRSDTVVNCQDTFLEYYKNIRFFDGGHRLDEDVVKDVLIPLIKEVLAG